MPDSNTPALPEVFNPIPPDINPWGYPGEVGTGPAAPTAATFPYLENYVTGNLPGWPVIAAAFSDRVDPTCLTDPNCFSVWKSSLTTYQGKTPVAGKWVLAGPSTPSTPDLDPLDQPAGDSSAAVFLPSEGILRNHRYIVHIGKYIKSAAGKYLGETTLTHFLSRLEPMFIDPYAVRMRLNEYSDKVGDEQLYYEVWRASMQCNRETMPFVPVAFIGGPTAEQVAAASFLDLYAIQMYVELQATEQILRKLVAQTVDKINRRHQGLDFQTEVEDGLLKNLQLAIQLTMQEKDPFLAEISRKRTHIRNVQKASLHPRWATLDMSFPGRKRF